MLKNTISKLLSTCSSENEKIFDGCIHAIEMEFGKPVTSMMDLKKREDKKAKGDIWERFCKDWLLASGKYVNVWLFQEWILYCELNKKNAKGLKSKQDNGIDLIAQTESGYVAVQCKYRQDSSKKVSWNGLSTFIGLCERTGPWQQYIVMTNCRGVTRKIPKSKKDKSICIGTFRKTPRVQWLKMAELYIENKLEDVTPKKEEPKEEKKLSLEDLRMLRLKVFDK